MTQKIKLNTEYHALRRKLIKDGVCTSFEAWRFAEQKMLDEQNKKRGKK